MDKGSEEPEVVLIIWEQTWLLKWFHGEKDDEKNVIEKKEF